MDETVVNIDTIVDIKILIYIFYLQVFCVPVEERKFKEINFGESSQQKICRDIHAQFGNIINSILGIHMMGFISN